MTADDPAAQAEPEQRASLEQQARDAAGGGHRVPPGWRKRGGPSDGLARAGFIEYDRVLFFSDAVFAIAITLLAVSLHVPGPAEAAHITFGTELSNASPSLTAFGISFAVIALFWLGHHSVFRYVIAFDRPLMLLNLLFLGTIAFLPYPTEVLSRSTQNHGGAVVFYALCASAAGLTEAAAWVYAAYGPAGLTDSSAAGIRLHTTLQIVRGPAVFLASIPIALSAPKVAPYTWIAILPLSRLIDWFERSRTRRAARNNPG